MNPSFELELPEGTIERLEKRYEEARRLAHDRIKLRSRKITDESAYEMEMEGSDVDFDSFDDDWLENDENSIEGTDLGKQSIVEQEDTMAKDDTENHLEEHLRINTITQQTYKEQP